MPDDDKQKKTERLHMLISPAELEAIDEWRFANKIGTRAEAIRRLCQIGMIQDRFAEKNVGTAFVRLKQAWSVTGDAKDISDLRGFLSDVVVTLVRTKKYSQAKDFEALLEMDVGIKAAVEKAEKGSPT